MLDRTIEPSQVSEAILENSEAVKTPAMAVNAEPPATVFKDVIFYDDAVEEAKEILKQYESPSPPPNRYAEGTMSTTASKAPFVKLANLGAGCGE